MPYIFLPFLSAALYGLGYILLEKILKSVNILTYTVCSSIIFSSVLLIAALVRHGDVSFSFLMDKKLVLLFLATVGVNVAGWLITLYSLQKTSAVYTSFAEISYPLFVVLFLFLFFSLRGFGWQHMVGGALIFAGSIILVMAQSEAGKQ